MTFWPILKLWSPETLVEVAFTGSGALAAPAVPDGSGPPFMESESWQGKKEGYAFRTDMYGTGYYKDEPPPIEITTQDIWAEKEARKAKARAFQSHVAPTGADFRDNK